MPLKAVAKKCVDCGKTVKTYGGVRERHTVMDAPDECPGSGGRFDASPIPVGAERGLKALLASTEFPFAIDPFDGGRVKIVLDGMQIVLSAVQARAVGAGFTAAVKFGPGGAGVRVTVHTDCWLEVPRTHAMEMTRRLTLAAEIAEQWNPE